MTYFYIRQRSWVAARNSATSLTLEPAGEHAVPRTLDKLKVHELNSVNS